VFGDSIVDAGNTHDFAIAFAQPDPTPARVGLLRRPLHQRVNPADVVSVASRA
jgi:hypothetical protein